MTNIWVSGHNTIPPYPHPTAKGNPKGNSYNSQLIQRNETKANASYPFSSIPLIWILIFLYSGKEKALGFAIKQRPAEAYKSRNCEFFNSSEWYQFIRFLSSVKGLQFSPATTPFSHNSTQPQEGQLIGRCKVQMVKVKTVQRWKNKQTKKCQVKTISAGTLRNSPLHHLATPSIYLFYETDYMIFS